MQKRRKTAFQHELEQLQDAPSSGAAAVATGSPTSSKRNPKVASSTKRIAAALKKIKKESAEIDSGSESEYTDSPAKSKKKRVRRAAASTKKNYAEYVDEDYGDLDEEEREAKRKREQDSGDGEEYVDEAGGVNVLMNVPSSSEPSPTEAKFSCNAVNAVGSHQLGGKSIAGYTPDPKAILAAAAARRDSNFDDLPSGNLPKTPFPDMSGASVEDVFVDPVGVQHVQQNGLFANVHGAGGSFDGMNGLHFGGLPNNMSMSAMYGNHLWVSPP